MSSLIPNLFVSRGSALTIIFATLTVLASCQSMAPGPMAMAKGDQNNPWIVTINFQGSSKCTIASVVAESNTCGLSDPADICILHSKFLQWEGQTSSGDNVGFNIYFDPIKGGPKYMAPSATGKKKVQVDANVPPGTYKYSILGSDSTCDPDTDTVDPHMRVDD